MGPGRLAGGGGVSVSYLLGATSPAPTDLPGRHHASAPLPASRDAAAVGAFLALLWPRLRRGEATAVAVLAALLALVAVPTLPPGIPVLVAVLAVPLVLVLRRGAAAR